MKPAYTRFAALHYQAEKSTRDHADIALFVAVFVLACSIIGALQ